MKKMFSMLLVIMLCLMYMPAMAAGHSHPVCAEENCEEHGHKTFTLWNGEGSYDCSAGDNYVALGRDVHNEYGITVQSGEKLYLCLNGHDFICTRSGGAPVFVYEGGELIICDCAGEDSWGKISNNDGNNASTHGAIQVIGGKLVLYSGKIADSMGGGVILENSTTTKPAVFDMYGGEISGNRDGYISNGYGCGVYVNRSQFNMHGGRIVSNSSAVSGAKGGGVMLSSIHNYPTAAMTMTGGEISGNTLTGSGAQGAGVYIDTPNCTLTVSGTAKITGNKVSGKANNVYLPAEQYILNGGQLKDTGSSKAEIGVTFKREPAYQSPAPFFAMRQGMVLTELGCFTSDQGYTEKTWADGVAYFKLLVTSYSIDYELAGGNLPAGKNNPMEYTSMDEAFTLVNPVREGYEFAGWTGTGLNGKTMTVTVPKGSSGVRSYTANWTPIYYGTTYPISYNLAGGSLPSGKRNPAEYTDIGEAFTLVNPVRAGYEFAGWTGTGLTGKTMTVTIAKGSTGARSYTANWVQAAAHVHAACGKGGCTGSGHSGHNRTITYQPWDGTGAPTLNNGDNYLYLTGDAMFVDSQVLVSKDQTVYLCLNGKTLTYDGVASSRANYAFTVQGKLILCDCAQNQGTITQKETSGKSGILVRDDAQMELYGGVISGFETAIRIRDEAQLHMYGGELVGNNGDTALNISVEEEEYNPQHTMFIMHGGRICANGDDDNDTSGISMRNANVQLLGGEIGENAANGIVMTLGKLTLEGCTIQNNGVYGVEVSGGGLITMKEGTLVSGNNMGFWLNSGANGRALLSMTGGKIAKNYVGVYLWGADMTMMDGAEITGYPPVDDMEENTNRVKTSGVSVREGDVWDGQTWLKTPSTFTMTGGVISGHNARDNGGGVYVDHNCAFTMHGGTIAGNQVAPGSGTSYTKGSGVYNDGGTFTMTGGSIAENTGASYGAVCVQAYKQADGGVKGTFTMTGGSIVDNRSDGPGALGGGVHLAYAYAETDMTPYHGALTIGGDAKVEGNKAADQESNIYLPSLEVGASAQIRLTGRFIGRIGVTLRDDPTAGNSMAYLYRDDGDVTDNDLLCTFSDAVRNDPAKAAVYGRFAAGGKGWFGVMTEDLQAEVFSEDLREEDITPAMKQAGITGVKDVIDEMLCKIEEYGMLTTNVAHYEAELRFSRDGGTTWEIATQENFPAEGLWFELEFPSGSDPQLHDYLVTHMFASGEHAGEVEIPQHVVTQTGIRIFVRSLSPVSIAWQDKNLQAVVEAAEDLPKTGDGSRLMLWLVLLAAAGAAAMSLKKKAA